ncbi:MAG TPA: hypothetical protein VLO10_00025 [Candidatus Deferrimicrobium sp.]|nr:hypothetical protein [Candidatus Deferrimicrobium sp.]
MTEGLPTPPAPLRVIFEHAPHPRLRQRHEQGPATTTAERATLGLNGRIGVFITTVVGTMWAAYIFTVLALISLPGAISSGNTVIIVGWIAQTFLQLVLLPIIIVGQNVQSAAADKRSEQTYSDAEAILHECLQLQAHLQAQDRILDDLVTRLGKAA